MGHMSWPEAPAQYLLNDWPVPVPHAILSDATSLCSAGMVTPKGYPFENHRVVTRDRYQLTTFRIPYGVQVGRPCSPQLCITVLACTWACLLLSFVSACMACPLHPPCPQGPDGPAKPFSGGGSTRGGQRQPVLLIHGISLASTCWVVNAPDESLAFILADEGG